jgi:L-Ala-D/L-Glu epimerase
MFLKLQFIKKDFELKESFKISHQTKTIIKSIIIKINNNNSSGFGECIPYKRYGESREAIFTYLKNNYDKIIQNIKNNKIKNIKFLSLRNAIESALIHLNFKKIKFYNKRITAITLPIVNKNKLLRKIIEFKNIPLIKVKLNEHNVINHLKLIKKNCPKSKIIIDANEGWRFNFLKNIIQQLEKLNVIMIEQPLKYGQDKKLLKIKTKILFCADESFHANNKNNIIKYYKVFNVKLDKFGGIQNSLKIIKNLKKKNKKIFIGCMVSSSLSLVPALTLAKYSDFLDLDGAYFLKKDFEKGISYKNGILSVNKDFLWINKKGSQESLGGLFKN